MVVDAVVRLGLAFLLVLPLAWERERRTRSAGIRTHAILSASVCGFLLLGRAHGLGATDQADLLFGVLNGIGFVGSGVIVKSPERAVGMSTAVSLWMAGAIGAGVAFARREESMSLWQELPRIVTSLAIAFGLGVPVGWDREREGFGPGLRTYPLLAMGACAYVEISQAAFPNHPDAQARVFQALVSGIGFIGAGAIIKGRAEVHGLATAVSLWITVSVGIAAAYELFALAAVLSAATLIALRLMKPLKRHPEEADRGPDPSESS